MSQKFKTPGLIAAIIAVTVIGIAVVFLFNGKEEAPTTPTPFTDEFVVSAPAPSTNGAVSVDTPAPSSSAAGVTPSGVSSTEPSASPAPQENAALPDFHYEGRLLAQRAYSDGDFGKIAYLSDGRQLVSRADRVAEKTLETGVYERVGNDFILIENTFAEFNEDSGGLMLHAWTIDANDGLNLIYADGYGGGENKYLRVIGADGNVPVDDAPLEYGNVYADTNAIASVADKLYSLDGSLTLHINDLDGSETSAGVIPRNVEAGYFGLCSDNVGEIYLITMRLGKNTLYKYDVIKDEMVYSVTVNEGERPELMFYDAVSGSVNIVYSTKIVRVDAATGLSKQDVIVFKTELPFVLGMFSTGGYILNAVTPNLSEGLLFSLVSNAESVVFELEKASGAYVARDVETEIVITAIYKHAYLEECIARYAVANPGVSVRWDTLYSEKSLADAAIKNGDALQKFLAKIMANDVGDIVFADGANTGLDIYALFITDAFTDLTGFIESDKSYAELNRHILDGLRIDGKLRGLPLGVSPQVLSINARLAQRKGINISDLSGAKWSDVFKLAKTVDLADGEAVFSDMYWQLNSFIQANLSDLVDRRSKTANLRSDWFVSGINSLEEAAQTRGAFSSEEYPSDSYVFGGTYTWAGNAAMFAESLYPGLSKTNSANLFLPSFGGEINGNITVLPAVMCSISAKSKQAEEAWRFLSFALEPNQQALSSLAALPLNSKGMEQMLDSVPVAEKSRVDVRKFMDGVVYSYEAYGYVQDVGSYVAAHLLGEISLEDALQRAEQDIMFRLNE